MYFLSSIPAMFLMIFFSLVLFGTAVQGHMIMANPVPYGTYANPKIDNSPLDSSGSNYPCKVTSDPASWYSQDKIDNTYAAGSSQTLSFTGSAVHGGGSCQLALTSDMQPDAQTSWRVILSIESGCPTTDGTNPATYNWTVPDDLEPGKYSFAWTWISKEAGQPEYYMNCAPITVTAGSSSSKRSSSSAADYPELFVANLDSINSCTIGPDVDPVYPAPGPNVEKLLTGASPSFASVTSGTNCVPLSQTQTNAALPTPTAGGGSAAAATTTGGAAAASRTGAASAAAAGTSTSTSGVGVSGGGFATSSTTSAAAQATTTAAAATATTTTTPAAASVTATSASAASSSAASDTLSVYVSPVTPGAHSSRPTSSPSPEASTASAPAVTTTTVASSTETKTATAAASSSPSSSASPSSSSSSSSSSSAASFLTSTTSGSTSSSATATATTTGSGSSPTGSAGGSGASTKSGTCTDEGMFNCVGSRYQQCASGAWTAMQALPAGTTCQQGESEGLWARDVRVNMLRKARRARALGV